MILEAIDDSAWYYKAGFTDDGSAMLFHKMPGRLLKKVANRKVVAFISATLSISNSFDDFNRATVIQHQSKLSTIIEPLHHGKLGFYVSDVLVNTSEWLDVIQNIISTASAPILVVTPSHELAKTLGAVIENSTIRGAEETASQAAFRMCESKVLIAAGAWAGLDTPIPWASIVIPRVPHDRPVVIEGNHESSFLDI
jgi:hypothetical protein